MDPNIIKFDIKRKDNTIVDTVSIYKDSVQESIKLNQLALEKLTTAEEEIFTIAEEKEFHDWVKDNKALMTVLLGSVRGNLEYQKVTLDTAHKLDMPLKYNLLKILTDGIKEAKAYGIFIGMTRHVEEHKDA